MLAIVSGNVTLKSAAHWEAGALIDCRAEKVEANASLTTMLLRRCEFDQRPIG